MGAPLPLAIVLEKCFTQRAWSTIDASSGFISELHTYSALNVEDEDDDDDEDDCEGPGTCPLGPRF